MSEELSDDDNLLIYTHGDFEEKHNLKAFSDIIKDDEEHNLEAFSDTTDIYYIEDSEDDTTKDNEEQIRHEMVLYRRFLKDGNCVFYENSIYKLNKCNTTHGYFFIKTSLDDKDVFKLEGSDIIKILYEIENDDVNVTIYTPDKISNITYAMYYFESEKLCFCGL